VLLAMADQLGAFVDAVGGPTFVHTLLAPLQLLAVVEETAVRDRAVASLNAVLAAMPAEHVERYGWPLALKLGERDWYSSRTAACGILPCVYARLPTRAVARSRPWASESKGGEGMEIDEAGVSGGGREDALELYLRLSAAEEVPMVRRAAAAYLAAFGTALAEGTLLPRASVPASDSSASSGSPQHIDMGDLDAAFAPAAVPAPVVVSAGSLALGGAAAVTLLPVLTRAAKDDQDSVRLLACEGAVALARLANGGMVCVSASGMEAGGAEAIASNTAVRASVLAVITGLATDKSWRVRWSVANRFSEVARAFGAKAVSETLMSVFEKLAGDPEAEVRVAAAYRVGDVASVVAPERLPAILPGVGRLAEDAHDPVRMALACSILGLAAPLGTDATISALLPLFLKLLKDGSPHVRLNIIARLGAVHEVVALKLLSSALLPAITDLAGDRAWRVRLAVLQFIPGLAKQLGPDAFVATPELPELCVQWLSDSVSSIREAGVANLKVSLPPAFCLLCPHAPHQPPTHARIPAGARGSFRPRVDRQAPRLPRPRPRLGRLRPRPSPLGLGPLHIFLPVCTRTT
jgi:serine/threonine-protein phosphatase 2A regulatory subunit A